MGKFRAGPGWSIFRQFGTTSLLVYWVHIELVYGRWFGIWKQALSTSQVMAFTAALLVADDGYVSACGRIESASARS